MTQLPATDHQEAQEAWQVKRPWLAAVGFALVPLLFAIPAGAAATILELDPVATHLVTAGAMLASFLVALGVVRASKLPMHTFGWRAPRNASQSAWFIPVAIAVLLVLTIVIVDGTSASAQKIAAGVVLAVVVGLNEEAWYRGIIMQILRPLGLTAAVVGSAVLFSVVHAANLLGGADLVGTSLQLAFAALFGLVTALLVIRTGSLWPGIIWHAAHNSISFASTDSFTSAFITGYSLISLVLAAYAAWLWVNLRRQPALYATPAG